MLVREGKMVNPKILRDHFLGTVEKPKMLCDVFREALTEAELKRMMELELKEFPRLEVVRDTFVFCCFTGLVFIDLQTLKRCDISTDAEGNMWIRKKREKTDELSVIPLLEVPHKLIEKYKGYPKVMLEDVVLPVISNQRNNAYLKELADLAKINRHLTSHIPGALPHAPVTTASYRNFLTAPLF